MLNIFSVLTQFDQCLETFSFCLCVIVASILINVKDGQWIPMSFSVGI